MSSGYISHEFSDGLLCTGRETKNIIKPAEIKIAYLQLEWQNWSELARIMLYQTCLVIKSDRKNEFDIVY